MVAAALLAIWALGVLAAIDAIMAARTAQGAVAWALALITFPFLAVPAYAVFGRSRFRGFVEAWAAHRDHLDAAFASYRDAVAPYRVRPDAPDPGLRALQRLADAELLRGNRARLLVDGEATFGDLLAGIAAARHYVFVQSYLIRDDVLGGRLRDILRARCAAGVRVHVLYDEIGSHGLSSAWVATLREAGAEVAVFRPDRGRRTRFQLNFRNHRKIVVVDGTSGWVGGLNIGDEYLGADPGYRPWRDTHLRLDGPVVAQLQAVLVSDWFWATGQVPDVDWNAPPMDEDRSAMIVPSAPTQRLETAGLLVVAALNAARERIWLSTPYFVPDEAVMKALQLAALRGVDVRILTSGTSDSLAVHLASLHFIALLRDLGIRFHAFGPGFLHQKVMLVDDTHAAVGTANLDNRSFRLNFEVTALVADRGFAAQVEAMLDADFERSTRIDPAALDGRPLHVRLGVALARLAAPVL